VLAGSQDFSEVKTAAVGVLRDLLAAAEAVCDEDGVRACGTHGREKGTLGECLRDVELIAFEAKGAGHAAATGVKQLNVRACGSEELDFVGHLHDSLVMAVALDDKCAVALRRTVVGCFADQELAEEECVGFEFMGAWIVGKQVGELVAEDGGAAWLKDDDGYVSGQRWLERRESVQKIFFCGIQQAEVI
jgi:hypothetical protein